MVKFGKFLAEQKLDWPVNRSARPGWVRSRAVTITVYTEIELTSFRLGAINSTIRDKG